MAFPPAFIQLLGILSEMQTRNRQIDLAEKQFKEQQDQFKTAVKQYEEQHHDKEISDALTMLSKTAGPARAAIIKLQSHLDPGSIAALEAYATGQPEDLVTQTNRASAQGFANLTPEMQQQVTREAAMRGLTGMSEGQMMGSQLLSGGTQAMMQQPGVPAQAAGIAFQTQMSPFQIAQNDVSRGGVQAQIYGHNVQAMLGAEQMAIERLRTMTSGKDANGVMLEFMKFRQQTLDAMESPKASPGGNQQRLNDLNTAAWMMGRKDLIILDQNDPDAPRKQGMLKQMLQNTPGFRPQVPQMPGTTGPVNPAPISPFQHVPPVQPTVPQPLIPQMQDSSAIAIMQYLQNLRGMHSGPYQMR